MDANRVRFWMLADQRHWSLPASDELAYDARRGVLRLASRRDAPAYTSSPESWKARLVLVPGAIDALGTWAFWDQADKAVKAAGAVERTVPIFPDPDRGDPPLGADLPTDVCLGHDDVLYVALGGRVRMQDVRRRCLPETVERAGFAVARIAADPSGGAWVLGRVTPEDEGAPRAILARLRGSLLPDRPRGGHASTVFRPREENPDPPRIEPVAELALGAEVLVGVAVSPEGLCAVLTADAAGDARLRLLGERGFDAPIALTGARYPYSLAWLGSDRVALLLDGLEDQALAYPVARGDTRAPPAGEIYPLVDHDGGPFLHGVTLPPRYGTAAAAADAPPPSPLYPISLPAVAPRGIASAAAPLDCGVAGAVWHRVHLEASFPPRCGARLWLAATDVDTGDPPEAAEAWYEHRFADVPGEPPPGVPSAAWETFPSEIPFHPGLLHAERRPGRAGLFTVLVQRAGRRVPDLAGRYLWVRIELFGDGRATPEIAALRAYAPRFSYVDHYLPELYRESVFGPDADEAGRSTPASFLARFLANVEGVLTPIEDRIAASFLLTDPRAAPPEALEWLARFYGFAFDPLIPPERRRALLGEVPYLYRWRGTLRAFERALDAVTGGALTRGRILVVEDFRLRRTFATILGADLADEEDPLLAGIVSSGNSIVGDTLFLGEEGQKELLALYREEISEGAEREQVEHFLERLAHRVTVFVHDALGPAEAALIERIIELEAPAHLSVAVVPASYPFMVGVASLAGIDTYPARRRPPQPVRLENTRLGERDRVERPPTLDPRTEGGG